MNLLHLRYAAEVEKTGSITKAAEKLFTSQPSLSRGIKELEESLGFAVFTRTPKGLLPTLRGADFLDDARMILAQLERMETKYRTDGDKTPSLRISVPRASYIASAFARFARELEGADALDIHYKETNAMRAITNLLLGSYSLGIVRYESRFIPDFTAHFQDKGLDAAPICKFCSQVVISQDHPLARKEMLNAADLSSLTEIAHGDPYVPTLAQSTLRPDSPTDHRCIYVYERGSQFDLLSTMPDSYMWVSPIPDDLLHRYRLTVRPCPEAAREYLDTLIAPKNYRLNLWEKRFLQLVLQTVAGFGNTVILLAEESNPFGYR